MPALKLNIVGEIATLEVGLTGEHDGGAPRPVLAQLERLRRDTWHRGLLLCCRDLPANLAADPAMRRLPTLLAAFQRPVVALVDGSVAGIGCSLALSADFLLGTRRTRLVPAGMPGNEDQQLAGLFHLPRQLGLARTRELLRSGRGLDAMQARSLGLVTELVAPQASDARADQLIRHLAYGCGRAFGHGKRLRLDFLAQELADLLGQEEPATAPSALHCA